MFDDIVEDNWSDAEDGESKKKSLEAQETELQYKCERGLNFLRQDEVLKAISVFTSILYHPIMSRYHVADWSAINWKLNTKIISNLEKIYFNVNLALIGLTEYPIPFYMQALSIRPDFKDLWFNCGQAAISWNDWHSAEFCMKHCEDEMRSLEALILIYYLSENFLECTTTLEQLFGIDPHHKLGHLIREMMSETSQFWKDYHAKIFGKKLAHCNVNLKTSKIPETINSFKQLIQNVNFMGIVPQPTTKTMPQAVKLKYKLEQPKLVRGRGRLKGTGNGVSKKKAKDGAGNQRHPKKGAAPAATRQHQQATGESSTEGDGLNYIPGNNRLRIGSRTKHCRE